MLHSKREGRADVHVVDACQSPPQAVALAGLVPTHWVMCLHIGAARLKAMILMKTLVSQR